MEESVHRAIQSGLFIIEKCLRDILHETKTRSESKAWLLRVRHSDINDDVAVQLISEADGMLKEIQELQKAFNIGKNPESIRWRIITSLNQVWTILSDLTPDRLSGFGRMEAGESELLSAHVNKMHAIAEKMQNMLSP